MEKAILVIDRPESCNKCHLRKYEYDFGGTNFYCSITAKTVGSEIPMSCPLKPIPKKKEITESMVLNQHYQNLVNYHGGWNACLDEILGDTEDE